MSLKTVKNKIKSIDKTRQVTKAMEAVSAVKMRKSQALAISTRPYASSALKILRSISGAIEAANHPLLLVRPVKRTCLVIISGDKGLAGSYGAQLLKTAYRFMLEQRLDKENTSIIAIGKKANEHFTKRGWNVLAHFERWSDQVTFDMVRPLAEDIKSRYLAGDYDQFFLVSTHFISTLKQNVYARKVLPVAFENVEEIIKSIAPETGKYSEEKESESSGPVREYNFEPSAGEILNDLIPVLFNIQIYHSVLEANASEHSARMIAMKNASDNAGEISRALRLRFNKVRQASITREVSEIVGGMEAMKN